MITFRVTSIIVALLIIPPSLNLLAAPLLFLSFEKLPDRRVIQPVVLAYWAVWLVFDDTVVSKMLFVVRNQAGVRKGRDAKWFHFTDVTDCHTTSSRLARR